MGDVMGHYPIFPEGHRYKIAPKKLVLRHYPFRNKEQAEKKMKFRVRGRTMTNEDKPSLDHHERNILKTDYTKKVDHKLLSEYEEDSVWNYKIKYHPFTSATPPKREDVFSEDGSLKNKPKSTLDYRLELIKKNEEFNEFRKNSTVAKRTKRFISKKFSKR
jgi:hypothetical protein